MDETQIREKVDELETLLAALPAEAAPAVEMLVGLYGETLRRVVGAIGHAPEISGRLVADELVAHMLVLYDLHPNSLEERVRRAIEEVGPYIRSHGGTVELAEIDGDVARIRLAGSCQSCAASTATLKIPIREAVLRAAPELRAVEAADSPPAPAVAAPSAEAVERCDLCAEHVFERHRHLFDATERTVLCACPVCLMLFREDGKANKRYHVIPETTTALDDLVFDDLAWRALDIPVNVAYFVRSSHADRVVAYYPSPAGVVESLLQLDAWQDIERQNPTLAALEPDTQALLVNRVGPVPIGWIAGIDTCYRLVGIMRTHASGFHGGDAMHGEMARFFDTLPAPAAARIA